jgi:dihydroflavonol-4-reductase
MPTRVFVSGATGFIASHLIERLLAAGYLVRGSVRSLSDPARTAHLQDLPHSEDRLQLVEVDLTSPGAFRGHLDDCDVVIHTASPYQLNTADPERDLLEPALHGTRAMLEACLDVPRLRRLIITSSIAAITDRPRDGYVFTENDWNTTSSLDFNPYQFSKVRAEREAWSFIERHRPDWDLVVINPAVVMGPSMTPALNTSNSIVAALLNGTYPGIVSIGVPVVDVRDVADAHIRAMTTAPASGRYICSAETTSIRRIVSILRENGYDGFKLPTLALDNRFGTALMKLASWTQDRGTGQYLRSNLGPPLVFDNGRIRRQLGMQFRDVNGTILDTAADLVRWGHARRR